MPLVAQRNRFLSFAFAAADILVETDSEGTIQYAAGATGALSGTGDEELLGRDFARCLDQTSRAIFRAVSRRIKVGRRIGPVRVRTNARDARLTGWRLSEDAHICWALTFESGSEPEELDPQAFERRARDAIEQARERATPFTLSALLIRGVQPIEERIGASEASRLEEAIRASCENFVGHDGVSRRVGPERIALIHAAAADASKLESEIRELMADFGLADAAVQIDSMSDALDIEPKLAVQAFIHAVNEAGESDAALDITSLHEMAEIIAQRAHKRMKEMRTTIAGRVFEPFAQPIVNLETGEVAHYELLLRLPNGQALEDNLGFAESTGLICEIDYAMTEIAAHFLREDFDRPSLAVNLSARSLSNMAWSKRFLALVADLKIDRNRLSFELTETVQVRNQKAANAVLQKLRERGHKVCIDDFGAGSAGLHYLRAFDADVVKIDGSYVRNAGKSKRDTILMGGMISMCQQLGIKTVAEMIESERTADLIRSMGVTYGQGFYFGKPVPLETLKDKSNSGSRAA